MTTETMEKNLEKKTPFLLLFGELISCDEISKVDVNSDQMKLLNIDTRMTNIQRETTDDN